MQHVFVQIPNISLVFRLMSALPVLRVRIDASTGHSWNTELAVLFEIQMRDTCWTGTSSCGDLLIDG